MSWHNIPQAERDHYATILTPLQLEVVRHRVNGHSWRTIAIALNRNEATIRGHHRAALDRINRHEQEAA